MMAILIFWVAISPITPAQGMRGIPGSPEFAYGGHLEFESATSESIRLAAGLNLDWMGLTLSWQQIAPQTNAAVDWTTVDATLKQTALTRIPVMVSLTHPPNWAVTEAGPKVEVVTQVLLQLFKRYPSIKALELFPQANTREGWGAKPNPTAYHSLVKLVKAQLVKAGFNPILVAAGLKPVSPTEASQNMDDLAFLQKLYEAGATETFSVVSLNLSEIQGQPLDSPTAGFPNVLRRYELIRQIMLKNNHASGLIWITHLNPPSGKINPGEIHAEVEQQAAWLSQAYNQIRSQLYIGTTFLNGFSSSKDNCALILSDGSYHPFYHSLRGFIAQSASGSSTTKPGRAKEQPILKKP